MTAHIAVDLHTVIGTPANVSEGTQVDGLLHGAEELVLGDAGYQGAEKRDEHQGREVQWHIAIRPSALTQMKRGLAKAQTRYEHAKASLRQKWNIHSGHQTAVRLYESALRGMAKNTAQLKTLFALSNLWMARRHLLAAMGEVRS